jgi:hypothetical protein
MKPHRDAVGAIDNVSLILEVALLYALDLSLLHREDGESKCQFNILMRN